jgi:hypothetical protein
MGSVGGGFGEGSGTGSGGGRGSGSTGGRGVFVIAGNQCTIDTINDGSAGVALASAVEGK